MAGLTCIFKGSEIYKLNWDQPCGLRIHKMSKILTSETKEGIILPILWRTLDAGGWTAAVHFPAMFILWQALPIKNFELLNFRIFELIESERGFDPPKQSDNLLEFGRTLYLQATTAG